LLAADEGAVETLVPPPKCPRCAAELKLGANGQLDCWSCPAGHGLGITLSEAYGRVQDDEIRKLWEASETASPGKYKCPWCAAPMASVALAVDGDEAAEGDAADRADSASVPLDVCREDQFIWLDAGELDELPLDLRNPEPSPDEQRKIRMILSAFDHDLEQAYEDEANRGILNKLANGVVRRHPGFASALEHAVYGHKLDELEAETLAAHRKLEAEWASQDTSSAA
jgi:Zn-finger nucleic acid-binding protein